MSKFLRYCRELLSPIVTAVNSFKCAGKKNWEVLLRSGNSGTLLGCRNSEILAAIVQSQSLSSDVMCYSDVLWASAIINSKVSVKIGNQVHL